MSHNGSAGRRHEPGYERRPDAAAAPSAPSVLLGDPGQHVDDEQALGRSHALAE